MPSILRLNLGIPLLCAIFVFDASHSTVSLAFRAIAALRVFFALKTARGGMKYVIHLKHFRKILYWPRIVAVFSVALVFVQQICVIYLLA